MKKMIVVGRPYSNGGDYLIFDRVFKALQKTYPEAHITMDLKSQEELDAESLNTYDAIITGGGGAQFSEPHIKTSFIYRHFDELTVPVHYMGTGLYGADGSDATIYQCRYSDEVIDFFHKVTEHGGQLGTRDWIVDTVLKNNGITDTIMTGCPAWYDPEMLERLTIPASEDVDFSADSIKRIAVSNHGLTKNARDHAPKLDMIKGLIRYIKEKYAEAEILLTFNDGYQTKYSGYYNFTLRDWALEQGVQCVDLSGAAEKFQALNEVDLHIGFRVHTHIYCLSRKIPSILIEEDIRGYGMNETLHLPHITAYREGSSPEDFQANPYLISKLDVILSQGQERLRYDEVSRIIADCYHTGMQRWLSNIL